jgi:hypothetical protein
MELSILEMLKTCPRYKCMRTGMRTVNMSPKRGLDQLGRQMSRAIAALNRCGGGIVLFRSHSHFVDGPWRPLKVADLVRIPLGTAQSWKGQDC